MSSSSVSISSFPYPDQTLKGSFFGELSCPRVCRGVCVCMCVYRWMVWLNTARGDDFEVGEHCLPVPPNGAWWALNIEQRGGEDEWKEGGSHQADRLLNPCIKLGQSANCHSPSLLHSFTPTHTLPWLLTGGNREAKWMVQGWAWMNRRQKEGEEGNEIKHSRIKRGTAWCSLKKKRGGGGLERSWAQQSLKTFWDSICIASHDPLQKHGTLVLGVRRNPQKKRNGSHTQLHNHPCKEPKPHVH